MTARSRRYCAALALSGSLLLVTLPATAAKDSPDSRHAAFWSALQLEAGNPTDGTVSQAPSSQLDVWNRVREGLTLSHEADNARVAEWLRWYRDHPEHVEQVANQARPWLYWVTTRLDADHLPGEIALLPFIESGYDPTAVNPSGAAGLWQFMPATGDAVGLSRTPSYDARRDVVAATDAAMAYIRQLADRWYEGDILLGLAAYNAGAGTVNAARRAAANRGDPIDYWHLRLPSETMDYVPRLLALAEVIDNPQRYGILLPDIPDRRQFASVDTDGPLTLAMAAELAGVDTQTLRDLNPGFGTTSASPRIDATLLLPVESRPRFLARLEALPDARRAELDRYVVERGDTLSGIAQRFGTTSNIIRQRNGLQGSTIRIGQTLSIPSATIAQAGAS